MLTLNKILDLSPFLLPKSEKETLFQEGLSDLTKHHCTNCLQYKKILETLNFDPNTEYKTENLPFVPVRLFKDYELLSVPKEQVVKTVTSSGTTGQSVSKIFLDRDTASYQIKVLAKIVADFIGKKRLPLLIIDTKATLKDRNLFSARGAGILGFSMLGYDVTYALDENMQLDFAAVESFCKKHNGENILLFGFTFIVWECFYQQLKKQGKRVDLSNGILLHGGGWKKLIAQAVDNDTFKRKLKDISGLTRIHNYYGMAEQIGSIFMECEDGHLHSSIFSDVIVRDNDFEVCEMDKPGLVQLISLLPFSYPGHSILSEDLGEIIGEDDCSCGRLGKYFKVHGRVKDAEIRGCSDTFS
ncbi:MAG: acyl-protein synthetase [Gammaproteobacteria bacterium]